jgi:NAD(P)-dependent dehydrogenase (short-subunit alcohol dehydrogenase family)
VRGLAGKVALVTGAAQGIGFAIAHRLAAEGMAVAVADIDGERAASSADTIHAETGSRTLALAGDVSREEDARTMVDRCGDVLGSLTVLVNNAGVDVTVPVVDVSRRQWVRVHDVDLWGPFLLVREALTQLTESGGTIVNIASTHAVATIPDRTTYAAAKAGVVGLTRALAVELGPAGVRANVILPGYIRTPMWDLWLDKETDAENVLERIAARHPIRRLGGPEDVAGVVAFLASEDASFITGSVITVDGGYTTLLEHPFK